jgi:hypothetical protein
MDRHSRRRRLLTGIRGSRSRPGLILAVLLISSGGSATDFRVGELEGLVDVSLSYGLLVRTHDRDESIIGIANGGTARSVNFDDGNLNYDTGVTSNMVKGSVEIGARWRNLGGFARAIAFYDFETELWDRERTQISNDGRRLVGKDVEAREYYLSSRFDLGGVPIQLRAGNQVLNWGESAFLRLGVDIINPLDLVAISQPAGTGRDLFLPQGMIWGVASLTENFALEAFYQYDWQETPVVPVGSYLSTNDVYGGDGTNFAVLGEGMFSDLGTNLDTAFGLPAGTLGFDRNFLKIPGGGRDEARSQGQFGVALQAFLPRFNATKLGLHFVNYHSRLALVSGSTAGPAAVAATAPAVVEARAAALVPVYESTGLDPAEAEQQATATASALTLSGLANETRYFAEFPEDIRMLGVTFNTATLRTGTLIAGEVSHHFDFPFQILSTAVLEGALSPLLFDPSLGDGPLGSFGPNQTVRGFVELDKTQVALNLTQLLGPRLGASQSLVSLDVGWIHVHDMPRRGELPLNAPGITPDSSGSLPRDRLPTADSVGYRLLGQLTYSSVLGGLNVSPRVFFSHDAHGVTPGPFTAFVEDRKAVGVGVGLNFLNAWTADLGYTSFFGAGRFNLLRDRDAFRLNLTYYY